MFTYTRQQLNSMRKEELRDLQRQLAQFVGTKNEQKARQLNHMIMDELNSRPIYVIHTGE